MKLRGFRNQTLSFPLPILALLSFLFIILTLHLRTVIALGNETDYNALLAIKSQLVESPRLRLRRRGTLSSWNNSVHHCKWEGVFCGRKHNRVVELDLGSVGLEGTISPYIGNLSFLESISLDNNNLYGEIPPELGHLFRLQELQLTNNTLTGEIPPNFSGLINLEYVSLAFNNLQGNLPPVIGTLSKLKWLALDRNNLSGRLFNIIANLTSLQVISVSDNNFTGTIPDSIGRMRNLSALSAGRNQLSGILPTSLFNLSSIQFIDVPGNMFQGELPWNIGFTTPRLQRLNVDENNISGTIPITITNLTQLEYFSLSGNSFAGRIPDSFGQLLNLNFLDIGQNNLVGDINFISTLVNCTNLQYLALKQNDFSGMLPKSIANLSTSLEWLDIGNNSITGTLPQGITNLINLKRLDMSGNELTASLLSDFGKLKKLENLVLDLNRLTGEIPSSLGNLSLLTGLYLSGNELEGNIPSSLGKCQSLLYLSLYGNKLSGSIPSELFQGSAKFLIIYLSQNRLEGSIPAEISKQINLVDFRLSGNTLSGVIPDGLGNCRGLQTLYLDGNTFRGSIPSSLVSLASIQRIDLSRNSFSGPIPAYFTTFTELYHLNLSYNQFQGRVPTQGVFANTSAVFVDGNSKLCGGIHELHLPDCIEEESMKRNKRKMHLAHKVIIATVCTVVGVLAMLIGLYLTCIRKKRQPNSSDPLMEKSLMKVSYSMLLKATASFSSENLLGAGSFGSVYKGILDGKTFAIKVLNSEHRGASKSFMAECQTLRNIRHRNLIKIITACSSTDFQRNDFKALVYEFMAKGSLDRWLSGRAGSISLSQRVSIAIDVAHALYYLHHECETPIMHCDLKPSNILLDDDMVAHVGDFGLAKILVQPPHPNQSSTMGIRGTVGYAAPEYGLGSEASTAGDVYSYGIMLLELMTGKSPTDNMFNENCNLHMYARAALPDKVMQIIDPKLEEEKVSQEADNNSRAVKDELDRKVKCIISVISVGVSCSEHLPQERMTISEAISKLQAAQNNLLNHTANRT